ncbi:MAG: serine/threonine protein kinase [Clostridia bacterium]|nr:serine/threonine protein kinase [Clostridia bacterium]
MILRNALEKGAKLCFPGMDIEIASVLGQGSNAIVYKGSYKDAHTDNAVHSVLVKELFPFHPKGQIYRDDSGSIVVLPEAQEIFNLHKQSFERGNKAHLTLAERYPDKIGGNVNTFFLNGTLYTVLSESGGRDISASEKPKTLKILTRRMLSLLDALSAFHESNLLHLDISPDNILIVGKGENERCMLIDFNSVFSPEEIQFGEDTYFSVKQGFTSPEVVNKNCGAVSWSADLYSVAAVFFAMLMNRPLTMIETLQKNPPDVKDADLLKDAPETVQAQAAAILKKGLNALPGRRYLNIGEMRQAFQELMHRIDMLGVTHAALWEAGKKSICKLTRENPFYAYLTENDGLFPVRLTDDGGESMEMREFLDKFVSEQGESAFVVSGGGMGKTTLLLKSALELSKKYSPVMPAQMYLSLAGKMSGKADFLTDEILKSLRFTEETATYDGARHALKALLASPLKTKSGDQPVLILLLDGLNEATGDTSLLYQEIALLSKLPGLRILVTGRADEERIGFMRMHLSDLTEKDIQTALGKSGFLMPESEKMRSALKTPLMLSVFIRASQRGSQLSVNDEDDLLNAYIASLLEKEKDALGDDEGQKYRIDAAVLYVLCALARRMEKSGGVLNEKDAFECVKKARKTLKSKNLSRAFPMWIGHRDDIIMDSEDAFYGEIVHEILVHRMGLIVRAGGSIKIAHARIGEYLLKAHKENEKRIGKRKRLAACAWSVVFLLVLSGAYFPYQKWFKDYIIKVEIPKIPYDDQTAEKCLSYAVGGYTEFGQVYDSLARLLEDGLIYPEGFLDKCENEDFKAVISGLKGKQNPADEFDYIEDCVLPVMDEWLEWREADDTDESDAILDFSKLSLAKTLERMDAEKSGEIKEKTMEPADQYKVLLEEEEKENVSVIPTTGGRHKALYIRYLEEMLKTDGEVVSWSQLPFDGENAKKLILFSDECSEVYREAEKLYYAWRESDRLMRFCPEFKAAFIGLIKADAVVAVQLYQVVCAPHAVGEEDIWQPERMKNIALFSGMQTFFDTARSKETGEGALQDLFNSEARRQEALTELEKNMYQLNLYLNEGGNARD